MSRIVNAFKDLFNVPRNRAAAGQQHTEGRRASSSATGVKGRLAELFGGLKSLFTRKHIASRTVTPNPDPTHRRPPTTQATTPEIRPQSPFTAMSTPQPNPLRQTPTSQPTAQPIVGQENIQTANINPEYTAPVPVSGTIYSKLQPVVVTARAYQESNVTENYVRDFATNKIRFATPDGTLKDASKLNLEPGQTASYSDHLTQFCGGNKNQALRLSAVLTQNSLDIVSSSITGKENNKWDVKMFNVSKTANGDIPVKIYGLITSGNEATVVKNVEIRVLKEADALSVEDVDFSEPQKLPARRTDLTSPAATDEAQFQMDLASALAASENIPTTPATPQEEQDQLNTALAASKNIPTPPATPQEEQDQLNTALAASQVVPTAHPRTTKQVVPTALPRTTRLVVPTALPRTTRPAVTTAPPRAETDEEQFNIDTALAASKKPQVPPATSQAEQLEIDTAIAASQVVTTAPRRATTDEEQFNIDTAAALAASQPKQEVPPATTPEELNQRLSALCGNIAGAQENSPLDLAWPEITRGAAPSLNIVNDYIDNYEKVNKTFMQLGLAVSSKGLYAQFKEKKREASNHLTQFCGNNANQAQRLSALLGSQAAGAIARGTSNVTTIISRNVGSGEVQIAFMGLAQNAEGVLQTINAEVLLPAAEDAGPIVDQFVREASP